MFEMEGLEEALRSLGAVLDARGLSYRILVIGGSNLLLTGVISRPTADLDVVALSADGGYEKAAPLPAPLIEAVADVGAAIGLADNWLNAGPADLMDFGLPAGFQDRVTVRTYDALEVQLAGRFDLICFKLYAAVDAGPRSKHFDDLQRLEPTRDELVTAARWTITHDISEAFRDQLLKALAALGEDVSNDDL